jgi:hypothetical protein
MKTPVNPSGAPVLSCNLDDHCVQVDCETDLPDLPDSLADNAEAPDYVAHYCGLDYLAKHAKDGQTGDEAEETG